MKELKNSTKTRTGKKYKKRIPDELILELRNEKDGKVNGYNKIKKELELRGYKMSKAGVAKRVRTLGVELSPPGRPKVELPFKKIAGLRMAGLGEKEIIDFFKTEGINISKSTLYRIYNEGKRELIEFVKNQRLNGTLITKEQIELYCRYLWCEIQPGRI